MRNFIKRLIPKKNRPNLEHMLALTDDMACAVDKKGTIQFANQAFTNHSGEVLDLPINDLVHPDDLPALEDSAILDLRLLGKDGIYHQTQAKVSSDGPITYLVMRDIGDKLQQEQQLEQSQAHAAEILDSLPQAVFEFNPSEGIKFLNKGAYQMFGFKPEDLHADMTPLDFIVDTDHARASENIHRIIAGEKLQNNVYEGLRKDGTTFKALVNSTPIRENEQVVGLRGIVLDVTRECEDHEALQHHTKTLSVLSTISNDFIQCPYTAIDENINKALATIGELAGIDRAYVFKIDKRSDGYYMSNTHEWCAEGVEPQIASLKDIPGSRVQRWIDTILSGEYIHIDDVSSLDDTWGDAKKMLTDQNIASLLVVPFARGDNVFGFIGFDSTKKQKQWGSADLKLLRTSADMVSNALSRKYRSQQLCWSWHTLDQMSEAIYAVDEKGRIMHSNRSGWETLGLTKKELYDLSIFDIDTDLDPKEWKRYFTEAVGGTCRRSHYIAADGSSIPVQVGQSKSRLMDTAYQTLVVRDIREQETHERTRQIAANVENTRYIAGGVAHDMKNLLTVVNGTLELAKMDLKKIRDHIHIIPTYLNREYLDDVTLCEKKLKNMQDAVAIGTDLMRQMQDLSGKDRNERCITSIADLVEGTVKLSLAGNSVTAEQDYTSDIYDVEVDPQAIKQCLINLLINARQAMPSGGHVSISGSNITLPKDNNLELTPGEYVCVSITDTGIGIPQKDLVNIFTPYFTTKKEGSGYGLARVVNTLKNHGGNITVESEEGIGTTFSMYLPAAKSTRQTEGLENALNKSQQVLVVDDDPAAKSTQQGESLENVLNGSRRVLVVDDDLVYSNLVEQMIILLGYNVTCVDNSQKALEKYATAMRSSKPYSITLMDLYMPGMDGQNTLKELRKIDPDAVVIVSSGAVDSHAKDMGFNDVLPKPFSMSELSGMLSRYIEE